MKNLNFSGEPGIVVVELKSEKFRFSLNLLENFAYKCKRWAALGASFHVDVGDFSVLPEQVLNILLANVGRKIAGKLKIAKVFSTK